MLQPSSAIQYGQCHSLRTHDALEAGGLIIFLQRQIEADQQFFPVL